MPSAKKEELERLRQAQEDTEKGRAAMREKLELERAEQKRQEQQRAEQIAAERRELEQSVESDSFWNPPEEPVDEQESQLSSPYLDDLINRVAPAAGSGYAREDQAVLHTLKSNMPNAGVRPVVDSADWDHSSHLHEERMGDPCQTGFSWERTEQQTLLEEEDIADGFISMQNFHFGQHVQEEPTESEMDEIFPASRTAGKRQSPKRKEAGIFPAAGECRWSKRRSRYRFTRITSIWSRSRRPAAAGSSRMKLSRYLPTG